MEAAGQEEYKLNIFGKFLVKSPVKLHISLESALQDALELALQDALESALQEEYLSQASTASHQAAAPRCALQPQEKDQVVQVKAQAKGQVTLEVDGRDGQETSADQEVQEVSEGQAAQEEDRTARAVQADQDFQEYLEAQVGQTVSEDQVADPHPLLRRTADPQQQQLTGHRATPP